jgi:putative nucleotidyltransferase with HDIG domain
VGAGLSLEERVIDWLAHQDVECYLVGGWVRDRFLKRPSYDLDVATAGDGLRLSRSLADHFGGDYYPLDRARGTGRVILHLDEVRRLVVDIAHFRGQDLAADLADRDFTINALATSAGAPDEIIDLHGGLVDLESGLLRVVSDESIRNDPLRVLRAIRQAAQLGFALAPETESAVRRDGEGVEGVSGERIRDELARLLALGHAAPHLAQLDDLGLLTIIFPELEPLRGLAQPLPHRLDVFSHSLETVRLLEDLLDAIRGFPNSPVAIPDALAPFTRRTQEHLARVLSDERPRLVTLKLAALLHDTGKAAARTVDEEGRVRFLGHQKDGARIATGALRRLRFSSAEVRLGDAIVRNHMRPLLLANQRSVSSRAIYRFFRDTGMAGVETLVHALADHLATYGPDAADDQWSRLTVLMVRMLGDYWDRRAERIDPPPLVRGSDLIYECGLQPGPHIGELLEIVREAQAAEEVHSREEALGLIRAHLEEMKSV